MNHIRELRKAYNMRQSELAKELGVTQSTISGWENGAFAPNGSSLALLIKVFNVSTDYLLGYSESKWPTGLEDDRPRGVKITTFSDRLKELRMQKGITQAKFASIFKVSTGAIGNWEAGNRQPDYEMLQRLANYFDVSADYLLGLTDEKRPTALEDDGPRNEKERLILELFRQAPDALQDLALEALRQQAADREQKSDKKE